MGDIVTKLWGFCSTLRHDGMNYGDYIEQLTYLLFLKLAEEKKIAVPDGCKWSDLKATDNEHLLDNYERTLQILSEQKGTLRDIFQGAISKFRDSVNLRKLIFLIDDTQWAMLDIDLKASVYEGLLEKYATEQKGAGQYFTPREAIRSVVRCVKPDFRQCSDYTIHDPACGTAGFLIGVHEWIMQKTDNGLQLSNLERQRLLDNTFSGIEIVLDTCRLALMNLYLHGISDGVASGDTLAPGPHTLKRYNCILTNPPFGTKAGEAPNRKDFKIKTSNKQLNFIQHIINILKPEGKAAVIVPDNVLFEEHASREIRKILLKNSNLHTILRLPIGTFTPYSPGVKANVIFFDISGETKETWIYDLRTNTDRVTKNHPLTSKYFTDFEECYNGNPRAETSRFKRFSIKDFEDNDYNLDISWLKDESLENRTDLAEPEDLLSEAITNIETALSSLNELALKLNNIDVNGGN